MNVHEQLKGLVRTFHRDMNLAKSVQSPNVEDQDMAIKAAIVGFSYCSPTDEWAREHWLFVQKRLNDDYSSHELEWYGERRENVQLFASLCLGYLLGLYQANKIQDNEFATYEAHIPGIIARHNAELY